MTHIHFVSSGTKQHWCLVGYKIWYKIYLVRIRNELWCVVLYGMWTLVSSVRAVWVTFHSDSDLHPFSTFYLSESPLHHVICSTLLKMTKTALYCRSIRTLCVSPWCQKVGCTHLKALPKAMTKCWFLMRTAGEWACLLLMLKSYFVNRCFTSS